MSLTHPVSNSDETLDGLARDITAALMSGEVSGRVMWEGVEVLQQYADYLGELSETLPEYDGRITIARDGVGIRFPDVDTMVNYLVVGVMENGS